MSKTYYVCGYVHTLKSCWLKKEEPKHESEIQASPREVEIAALKHFAFGSAWGHLMQVTGNKVIIHKESSRNCSLPDTPKSVFYTDHWIFVIIENGDLHIWSNLESFLRSPGHSDYQVKSDTGLKKNCFRKIVCSDLTNIIISENDDIFRLCYEASEWHLSLLPDITYKVKEVQCGKEHFLMLTSAGLVLSFGLGSRGQLGHGDTERLDAPKIVEALHGILVTSISCGGWHSAAISECGDVYTWGWNESGQIGDVSNTNVAESNLFQAEPCLVSFPTDEALTKVSCGSRHSAALSSNGYVWTWGWNQYGQLCLGDRDNRSMPTLVPIMKEKEVIDIYCTSWMTFIETSRRRTL